MKILMTFDLAAAQCYPVKISPLDFFYYLWDIKHYKAKSQILHHNR